MSENTKTGGGFSRHGSKLLIAGLAIAVLPMAIKQHKSVAHTIGNALTSYATSRIEGPQNLIETQHYVLEKTWIDAPEDFGMGGAIKAFGEDVLLVTRQGAFHALAEDADRFEPIAWSAPETVQEDGFFTRRQDMATLGYQDLEIRLRPSGISEVFLSQTRVHPVDQCAYVVLYRAEIAGPLTEAAPDWSEVWASSPCLSDPNGALPLQAGGEMTLLDDGRVALFLGDFGNDQYNRRQIDPQEDSNDYGKVIAVDPETGADTILSKGHRNPGGLTTGLDGRIWLAENAARGGDEINEIIPGQNYGWPLETYTTNYGLKTWPVSADGDHEPFAQPAFAFVPSPALSSMDVMGGEQFQRWSGDLILGTLKDLSLYRIHLNEGDVILTERIETGIRARDLTIAENGIIYVKADRRPTVLRITPQDGSAPASSASILAQKEAGCMSCHGGWSAVAPNLDGIIGRRVASYPGFDYSDGLQSMTGRWTADRLEAFLLDPETVAPGTLMPPVDLTPEEISELVETLSKN